MLCQLMWHRRCRNGKFFLWKISLVLFRKPLMLCKEVSPVLQTTQAIYKADPWLIRVRRLAGRALTPYNDSHPKRKKKDPVVVGICPIHCRISTHETSVTPPSSSDNQKCPQTLPHVSWQEALPLLRNIVLTHHLHCNWGYL